MLQISLTYKYLDILLSLPHTLVGLSSSPVIQGLELPAQQSFK